MSTRRQHFFMPHLNSCCYWSPRESPLARSWIRVESARAGETWRPGDISKLLLPSGYIFFIGALRMNVLLEGPPESEGWGPIHRGPIPPGPRGASLRAHPPQLPQANPLLGCLGLKAAQAPGKSPGPQGLRGVPLAFSKHLHVSFLLYSGLKPLAEVCRCAYASPSVSSPCRRSQG